MSSKYLLTIACLLSGFAATAQQPVTADYLGQFDGEFAPVKIGQQRQSLHHSGAVLVDKTENIGYYRTVVCIKHNAYGAINDAGKIIAPFKFDEISIEDEQDEKDPEKNYCFVITRLNGKYGAIDTLGNIICQPVYDEIAPLTPHTVKVKKDGLYGWVDMKTGKVLQSPQYEDVDKSYVLDNTIQITQGGKAGLNAEDGSVIVKPAYESFKYLGTGSPFFGYTLHGKTGVMDKTGKQLTPAIYDNCATGASPALITVTANGKNGVVNTEGKLVLPLQYTSVEVAGNAIKVSIGKKWGIVNATGKEIIPPIYEAVKVMNSKGEEPYGGMTISVPGKDNNGDATNVPNWFLVTKGINTALFDEDGKQLTPFEYSRMTIHLYHDMPYVEVVKNGRVGLLNLQGKTVVPIMYDRISLGYNDGFSYLDEAAGTDKTAYLGVMKKNSIGLFNVNTGQEVLPPKYDWIQWQNSNILYLKNGDTTSIATKNGNIIRGGKQYGFFTGVDTNRIVETHYPDNGGTVCILTDIAGNKLYTNPRWEFKEDTYSRVLVPGDQRNGHAQFNNRLLKIWGDKRENVFVDVTGKEVVFDGCNFVGDFWNGLAIAGKGPSEANMVYGIINLQRQEVYPISADDIKAFENNYLIVRKGEAKGLIKKDGTVLLPVKYKRIEKLYDKPFLKISENEKYGITDLNGKIILPVEYDDIYYREKAKLFQVTKNNKTGIADITGHLVIPVIYDEMDTNRESDATFPLLVKEGQWYFYLDKNGQPFPYRSLKKKGYDD
jgi:hypothetical protein